METSCDETAAAVVSETGDPDRPWCMGSNVVASQVEIHREWGGVVPELASRQHIRDHLRRGRPRARGCGCHVVRSRCDRRDAGARPGRFAADRRRVAKALAASLNVPLVPVHHLAGHIESLVLENGVMPLPAVVLVVSGGHTSLYLVPRGGEYRLVGRTRDDAAGEAYDKVATLLGLEYPGGPVIDRLARSGNDHAVSFPVARMTHADRNDWPPLAVPAGFSGALRGRTDFSFSGLKTAVKRHVASRRSTLGQTPLSAAEVADICASFQRIVVKTLLDRTFEAVRWFGAASIGVAGGRLGQQPPARRSRSAWRCRRPAGLPAWFGPCHRQRRDDSGRPVCAI